MSIPHGPFVAPILAVALGATVALRAEDPPAPAASAGAELVGPQVILASQQPPVFPPAARAGRFSGSVMVEATVLPDGSVGEVKVLECNRPKVGFEQASIDAVKQWRFEPGTRDGAPVVFTLKFRLNFAGGGPGEIPRVSAGSFVSSSADGTERPPAPTRDTSSPAPRPNPPL